MPKRTDISKILIALSIGMFCFTFPSATLGCERSRPLAIPLEGEWQPYFETLGELELFKARKIEGSLESRRFVVKDGKHADQDTPLGGIDLKLRNAISGEIVKAFTTDDQGHFELGGVPPGSYVLQIQEVGQPTKYPKIHGNLLIELHPDAKEPHLPLLALSMSDCGMDVHKKNDQQPESTHAQTN